MEIYAQTKIRKPAKIRDLQTIHDSGKIRKSVKSEVLRKPCVSAKIEKG
ncbi:MAG: hypothetical protein Q4C96_09480 [Planctomycetia bacterium]|nr:hypothetical protein [Planctomycetia bacterium]